MSNKDFDMKSALIRAVALSEAQTMKLINDVQLEAGGAKEASSEDQLVLMATCIMTTAAMKASLNIPDEVELALNKLCEMSFKRSTDKDAISGDNIIPFPTH